MTPPIDRRTHYTTAEAAAVLGITVQGVWGTVRTGSLTPVWDDAGNYWFAVRAVQAYHHWRQQGRRGRPRVQARGRPR
jgi:hypothetical protein